MTMAKWSKNLKPEELKQNTFNSADRPVSIQRNTTLKNE